MTPALCRIDLLLTQAEQFRDRGQTGEALARARVAVEEADRAILPARGRTRAALRSRRLVAAQLALDPSRPILDDERWLRRALRQLDIAIHTALADHAVSPREQELLEAFSTELGLQTTVDLGARVTRARAVLEEETEGLEGRVRTLGVGLPVAAREEVLRVVEALIAIAPRLPIGGYRETSRSASERLGARIRRALRL